jgi:hypothetical protein
MDTYSREWNLTRDAREGGQTTCIPGICQTTTKSDVTARKYQNYHGYENLTSRGKGSTNAKYDTTGSVGAPARKGIIVGHHDRHTKIECRVYHSGRRRDSTKTSHCTTHGRYG